MNNLSTSYTPLRKLVIVNLIILLGERSNTDLVHDSFDNVREKKYSVLHNFQQQGNNFCILVELLLFHVLRAYIYCPLLRVKGNIMVKKLV